MSIQKGTQQLLHALAPKQHIIWDWNGTLLQDLEHNVRTVNILLAEAGLRAITCDEHRDIFRFPVVEYYRQLGFDISSENFIALCDRFNELYTSGLHLCTVLPELRETMASLHAQGKVQSILSASHQDLLVAAVERFELNNLCSYIHGIADTTATSKLSRGHELLDLSGIPAWNTVLIGDTDHDLEVGNALGVDVILVTHGHQSTKRLQAIHDTVIDVTS